MLRICYLIVMFLTLEVSAHPVIYKEGVVLSSGNMPSYSDNQLMYSWSNRWAGGVNHWRFSQKNKNTELALAKVNHLLYRHNGESSQANIYLHGGLGVVDAELGRKATEEAYMTGAEADWETRTLYTAIKYYHFASPKLTTLNMVQARIGFSPFESAFDQLQSWFMLQFMTISQVEEKVMITPMVRFFYKNVLWEMGSSTRGDWMLNLMVHY
jgi:hypothetical protein